MITDKNKILTIIKQFQESIESLGVKQLGLFGSYVRHEQNTESDIDFLVEFETDKKTFDNFIQLSFLLERILNHHVELVTAESISPYIKPRISKEVEYVISRS